MQLIYRSETIQIHIQRSRRKTLCISVNRNGSVMVKAPCLFPTDDEIAGIVKQKAEWILKQRASQQEKEEKKIKRHFETGYTFPYLGKERFVEMQQGKKSAIEYKNEIMIIKTPYFDAVQEFYAAKTAREEQICETDSVIRLEERQESSATWLYQDGLERDENGQIEKLRKELKKWYKKQAKEYITKRVAYYQDILGVSVTSVSIKSRKSQWGSCDSNGNLTFSWRLVMAAPKAIDYVVVHELCHRRHMDHSPKFWQEVKTYMPDYEEQKQWLEENAINLNIE